MVTMYAPLKSSQCGIVRAELFEKHNILERAYTCDMWIFGLITRYDCLAHCCDHLFAANPI